MGVLSNLEPKEVFRYFEEICGIPHGSGHTKQISDYLVQFAKDHGLNYVQDQSNNVIIWKDGSAGYETSAPVMLQGHMDMVCEKEPGVTFDFTQEGLRLQEHDGIVTAEGTTLGGDDGIAVAYTLTILASDTIPHPPIEAVFTVDEEVGMLGAAAMDTSVLHSRIMLNMDSEDEGYLLVSCAGGTSATCHLPVIRETFSGQKAELRVSGCFGGHSGVEIDKGRANANQLLGRALCRLSQHVDFRIIDVEGGKKDNAIPTESYANLVISEETSLSSAADVIRSLEEEIRNEYAITDSAIHIALVFESDDSSPAECSAMSKTSTQNTIAALYTLPGGIQRMSFDIKGLVQTSLNLGILTTTDQEVRMTFSVRSSVESEKQELTDRITCLMTQLGGTVTLAGDYPAWEYQKDSPLRDLMIEIFEEQYGHAPVVQSIHAGVECGLFAGKMPGLDCVSFGPDMKDIHTPRESMDAASVQRTWNYILEILRRLK